MSHSPRHPMSRLALLLGLALAGSAAQAADLASASASLSNLRYRLVDLDLNDGIAPSFSISSQLLGGAGTGIKVTPDGENPSYFTWNPDDLERFITAPMVDSTGTIELFSAQPGAKATLGSTLSASAYAPPGSVSDLTIYDTETKSYTYQGIDETRGDGIVRNFTQTYTAANNYAELYRSAGIYDPNAYGNLTLSANTLLVIEGTAAINLHRDAALGGAINAAFAANNPTLAPENGAIYDVSEASVILRLGASVATDETLFQNVSASFQLGKMLGYQSSLDSYEAFDLSDERNFSLYLPNHTKGSITADFDIGLSATVNVGASNSTSSETRVWGDPVDGPNLPDPGTTAPIPEPSTYALMGLGLVGLAAMKRRRQMQA